MVVFGVGLEGVEGVLGVGYGLLFDLLLVS